MKEQQEFTLRIVGMTCVHCGQHVTAALKEVPGVRQAEVPNWKTGYAIVATDERVVPETLLAAVGKAGYTATVQKKLILA